MEDNLVEVYRVANPKDKRFVTRDAAEFMKPKWQRVDAIIEQPKKSVDPVVDSNASTDALNRLRGEYKKISGKDADPDWTHARVHIEIKKEEAGKIQEVAHIPSVIEELGETAGSAGEAEVEKKKKGRKAKTEEPTQN